MTLSEGSANWLTLREINDLDTISIEIANSILQAEAEAPGSQPSSSVRLAEQILAQLREPEPDQTEIHIH